MEKLLINDLRNRRFSPKQKKEKRYLKDRRNVYGENNKASRKSIRFRKKVINRTYRKNTKQELLNTNDSYNDEYLEFIDIKICNVKRNFWKKYPDIPLKEFLERQTLSRIIRINRKNSKR